MNKQEISGPSGFKVMKRLLLRIILFSLVKADMHELVY